MTNPAIEFSTSITLAMAMGALVVLLHRGRAPLAVWLAFALVPTIAIWLANPEHRIHSFHGFFHASIVKRVASGALPPDNPLFAGAPISYGWMYHVIAARLSALLDVTPSIAFAILNTVSLPVSIAALARLAKRIHADPSVAALGVVLALFGVGFANDGYVVRFFGEALGWELEFRGLPPATYFSHVNVTAIGLAALSVFLAAVTGLVTEPRYAARRASIITAMVVLGGVIYPFHLPALIALAAGAAAASIAFVGHGRRAAVLLLGSAAAGGALVAPYLASLVSAKAPEATPGVGLTVAHAPAAFARLGALLAPVAVLLCWDRRAIAERWRRKPALETTLWLGVAATSLPYVAIAGPLRTEYKYLTITVVLLGLLSASTLSGLVRARPILGWVVLSSFLLPWTSDATFKALHRWEVVDPVVEEGQIYRHRFPNERALYDWIRTATDPSAVFVDDHLSVPVLGERRLFVGLDRRRNQHRGRWGFDGWGMRAETILRWIHGVPESEIQARRRIAGAFLDPDAAALRPAAAAIAVELVSGAPLYVLARDPVLRSVLEAERPFRKAYDGPPASVFRVVLDS